MREPPSCVGAKGQHPKAGHSVPRRPEMARQGLRLFFGFLSQRLVRNESLLRFPGGTVGAAGGDPGPEFLRPPECRVSDADGAGDPAGCVPGPPRAQRFPTKGRSLAARQQKRRGGRRRTTFRYSWCQTARQLSFHRYRHSSACGRTEAESLEVPPDPKPLPVNRVPIHAQATGDRMQ